MDSQASLPGVNFDSVAYLLCDLDLSLRQFPRLWNGDNKETYLRGFYDDGVS